MFSKEDYHQYFTDIEDKLAKLLTAYTDLLNDLDNRSVRSKINSITAESLETYRFIKEQKTLFTKETQ